MGRAARRVLLGASLALAALVLSACGSSAGSDQGDAALAVTTTTNFITDTVANVGGDRVHVEALMGPGVDPHLYRASAGDVDKLADADVIFYGGLHLEGKMGEVLEEVGETRPTIAVTSGMDEDELIAAADPSLGEFDPHVWFDVGLWRQAVETVRDSLIEADPEGRDVYEANAERYLAKLDELDRDVRERLATIPRQRRVLITSHDAFHYLGRAYDVEVAGIQGISTQSEATTADIDRTAQLIADRGVKAVFVESSVPPQTIEAVIAAADEKGAEVEIGGELFSDAAGEAGTREGTYVGMVEHNVDALVEGLR